MPDLTDRVKLNGGSPKRNFWHYLAFFLLICILFFEIFLVFEFQGSFRFDKETVWAVIGIMVSALAFALGTYFAAAAVSVYATVKSLDELHLKAEPLTKTFAEVDQKAEKSLITAREAADQAAKYFDYTHKTCLEVVSSLGPVFDYLEQNVAANSIKDNGDLQGATDKTFASLRRAKSLLGFVPFVEKTTRLRHLLELAAQVGTEQDLGRFEALIKSEYKEDQEIRASAEEYYQLFKERLEREAKVKGATMKTDGSSSETSQAAEEKREAQSGLTEAAAGDEKPENNVRRQGHNKLCDFFRRFFK